VTDTPRETRVLDAVVSLVDSLLGDFDVVDLLTDLAERCAELLDIEAAGFLLAATRCTSSGCWPPPQSRPVNSSSSSCKPTKAHAWTATPRVDRFRSPTSNG